MDCTASFLPYEQTRYFSRIVTDYISQAPLLQPFYNHPVSLEGIRASIDERRKFNTNRILLHQVLSKQYAGVETSTAVQNNIELLLSESTFTICTAHQPNIFTGPLFFIYKILHTIKLADWLNSQVPDSTFVPVYYMGSEDADLDELGHFYINGEKYTWETSQKGAVGRMKVDKELLGLLETITGQLLIHPHGDEVVNIMKDCYKEGQTIEQATFQLVNRLLGSYGVLIVLPDNAALKRSFLPVIQKELTEVFSHEIVKESVTQFPDDYKVQASGRELNMFYLVDDKRERIEMMNDKWVVLNTDIKFNRDEIITELKKHPERFSPNVILRPVFQEWILPNIAFVGGGGEIAYWLQLKSLFGAVGVPYPLILVRNSFMLFTKEMQALADKLQLSQADLFHSHTELMNQVVKRDSQVQLSLENENKQLTDLYNALNIVAGKVDITLKGHVDALRTNALNKLTVLEKKMLRAEKKKFEAQKRQLHKLKLHLFPNNNLQERIENFMPDYAKWGKNFIKIIYDNSPLLEQQFTILTENK